MERIFLKNHTRQRIDKIKDEVGRMFAVYFNNKNMMMSADDPIREGFFIGDNPLIGKCYLVVYENHLGLVIEPLGESLHYIEINSFIDNHCDPRLKLKLERILFEHS